MEEDLALASVMEMEVVELPPSLGTAKGNRVVFVVDFSASMIREGGVRLKMLKQELVKSIQAAGRYEFSDNLLFNSALVGWRVTLYCANRFLIKPKIEFLE